jgi:hypothetical protein
MKMQSTTSLKENEMKKVLALVAVAFALTACDQAPTSTQIERRKQEELSMQAVTQVGMPSIVNFAEKRMMKDIMELRDQNVATTTYITDMNGKLHKVCNSVGYGLPYATQYTNPQRIAYDSGHGSVALPQADPNGLYSPASADGTWVLCVAKDGKAKPVFIEPRVIVSPIPLGE